MWLNPGRADSAGPTILDPESYNKAITKASEETAPRRCKMLEHWVAMGRKTKRPTPFVELPLAISLGGFENPDPPRTVT